ncbi:MAG: hypothetical protein PVJ76_20160 [Gemmatimonadota bacterium]
MEGLRRFVELGGHVDDRRIRNQKPPIQNLVVDDNDWVWVSLATPGDRRSTLNALLDSDGKLHGFVEIPARLSSTPSPVVKGSHMVGVEADALGVQSVLLAILPELGS